MKPWFWILCIVCSVIEPPSIPAVIFAAIGYTMWQSRQDKKEQERIDDQYLKCPSPADRQNPEYLQDLAQLKREAERYKQGL